MATVAPGQQWSPTLDHLDSYSRIVSNCILVRPPATPGNCAGSHPQIWSGAGGDLHPLEHHRAEDHGAGDPVLHLRDTSLASYPLTYQTGGIAMDLADTSDFVYVAAFRNGLWVYDVGLDVEAADQCGGMPCWEPPAGSDVISVAATDVKLKPGKTGRIVVVGTEEREVASPGSSTGGRLHVLVHDRAAGLVAELVSYDVGAPVLTLVAGDERFALAGGNLVVLLGTECARIAGEERPLQRHDLTVFPSLDVEQVLVQGWTTRQDGAPKNMVIRDLVLDPDPQATRVYAACYWDGVQAFDLSPDSACDDPHGGVLVGLCADTSPGWPIKLPRSLEPAGACASPCVTLACFNALAAIREASSGRTRLYAGAGSRALDSWHDAFLSDLSAKPFGIPPAEAPPESCGQEGLEGIFVYGLDGQSDPVATELLCQQGGLAMVLPTNSFQGSGPKQGSDLDPRAIAVLEDTSACGPASYHVYVAADLTGVQVYRERQSAGAWTGEWVASWARVAPARLVMPQMTDATMMVVEDDSGAEHDVLYCAAEGILATFDLDNGSPTPLAQPWLPQSAPPNPANPLVPHRLNNVGSVVLGSGFGGVQGRLVGGTLRGRPSTPGGVRIYDLGDPVAPTTAPTNTELVRYGFGYAVCTVPGMYSGAPPSAPDRARYVYSVGQLSPGNAALPTQYLVRLWDIGSASAPLDPVCTGGSCPDACNMGPVCLVQTDPSTALKAFVTPDNGKAYRGCGVLQGDTPDVQYVYSLYFPRDLGAPKGGIGLATFEARLDCATCAPSEVGMTQVFESPPLGGLTTLTASHAATRLTVDPDRERVYGTWVGFLACWSIADPASPTLIGYRDLRNYPGDYGATPWATDVELGPTIGGRSYVYLSFSHDGLAILDATDGPSFQNAPFTWFTMPWQSTSLCLDQRDPKRRTLFVTSGSGGVDHFRLVDTGQSGYGSFLRSPASGVARMR